MKLTIAEKIELFRKENEKFKKRIIKEGTKLFDQAVKELFRKNKDLESFDWNQYTPNWNDGQECVFSCHFDSLSINGESQNGDVECLWKLEEFCSLLKNKKKEESRIVLELSNKNNKSDWAIDKLKDDLEILKTRSFEEVSRKREIKKQIIGLLSGIEEKVYQEMFGEGKIVVSRKGVDVEDCQHD